MKFKNYITQQLRNQSKIIENCYIAVLLTLKCTCKDAGPEVKLKKTKKYYIYKKLINYETFNFKKSYVFQNI